MPDLCEALQKHFGHSTFRSPQDAVIQQILDGRDTLVIMPTGGGKSLCYQLPALLLPGVTLVVSPLIALMKDQVDALRAKGIPAGMINSSQDWDTQRATLAEMEAQRLKLVYIAPERFRAQSFMASLARLPIAMLAIDEAHCISQWGHDFRPDYMRLGEALDQIGRPLCSAFTATATPDVRDDIQRQLKLRNPAVFVSGFARPNLSFNIRELKSKADKTRRALAIVRQHHTGIVYCATRKSVESVTRMLAEAKITCASYHAGLPPAVRTSAQEAFVSGKVPVAVATSAFGMGIDRADIRFVCHFEMPGSVEAFYQEAGRAGRDGLPAICEMLFLFPDKRVQEFFIEGANPSAHTIRSVYSLIRSRANDSRELFLSVDDLTDAMPEKTNPMGVHTAISHLVRARVIERFDIPGQQIRGTRLLQPALAPRDLDLPTQQLAEKKRRDMAKLRAVLDMAYARECRQTWILRYFGEHIDHDCGRCDHCTRSSRAAPLTPEQTVVVQKALSGAARLSRRMDRYTWEARFGKSRFIKCLLGESDERIEQAGHNKLSTFGILKPHGRRFVTALTDAMIDAGYLQTIEAEFPLIGLTGQGARAMFGEIEIVMEWPDARTPEAAKRTVTDSVESLDPAQRELFDQLVALRDEIRRERGNVPAYTIFSNKVLVELATQQPRTLEQAATIKGIGPAKIQDIAPRFLELLNR